MAKFLRLKPGAKVIGPKSESENNISKGFKPSDLGLPNSPMMGKEKAKMTPMSKQVRKAKLLNTAAKRIF